MLSHLLSYHSPCWRCLWQISPSLSMKEGRPLCLRKQTCTLSFYNFFTTIKTYIKIHTSWHQYNCMIKGTLLHVHKVGGLTRDRFFFKTMVKMDEAEAKRSRFLVPSVGRPPKMLDPTIPIKQQTNTSWILLANPPLWKLSRATHRAPLRA